MSDQIVVFEDWERVMKETVPVALHGAYREAVVKFRYWLRKKGGAISNNQYSIFNEQVGAGLIHPRGEPVGV